MSDRAMLIIHALTGLHPGAGTSLGVVDLPVQRERHTQWPTIPGSSLKGVIRDSCRKRTGKSMSDADDDDEVAAAFGPSTRDADIHAGALSLSDARLLAFPVRSLRGVFAWVVCPSVLERLQRDLALLGMPNAIRVPEIASEEVAVCHHDSPLLVDGNKLILEEFEFTRQDLDPGVIDSIATRAASEDGARRRLAQRLIVLHDDAFTHFARFATEVVARVGLNAETKTVRPGALFYEEFLPAETILYSLVLAADSRRSGVPRTASQILDFLQQSLPPVLQVGGDETIGKGLCAVHLSHGPEGSR